MKTFKKIAVAAVSVVMAGSMAMTVAACGPNEDNGGPKTPNRQTTLTPSTENGKLKYAANTQLTLAVGYNNGDTGITFSNTNASQLNNYTLMGHTISSGTLKPGWAALQSQLGVTFNDVYAGVGAGDNISTIKNDNARGGLAGVTVFTGSAVTINQEGMTDNNGARESLLDISQYLDYMPNYKAFLESSPIIQASLIADSASNAMYMVPYFDGNDDIEKFVILRKDIVETLLDGVSGETLSTTTFKAQADAKNNAMTKPASPTVGTSSSVESFMGTTGSWTVATTDPASLTGTPSFGNNKDSVSNNNTVNVKVNYTAAHDAAVDGGTALGAAVAEAAGTAYTGDSGNIVDLQNFAINQRQGEVTGGQLLNILRAYIDVAYTKEDDTQFYTSANGGLKRSDVFNGACAAWDADLYAALGRCFVTCGSMLGDRTKATEMLYLVAGRQFTTQRTTDVASLAGELYGERGLESRYNYTYIDSQGNAKDGRSNEGFWNALEKMNDLAKEGLFNTSNNVTNNWASVNHEDNTGIQTLSIHDYVQTQTSAYGFQGDDDYNFAPVLTPVSNWDTNDDGTKETRMRFTESWRSVKDGGIAISYQNVKNDPDKLAAALAFIDYIYSNDGQILMTYGPYSSNGNTNPNGLWYATEATGVTLANVADEVAPVQQYAPAQYKVKDQYKAQYFVYNGKVYEGMLYNGRQIPILTSENLDVFNRVADHNFTNHARRYLGTCLPIGNKDQGFEYQCTATCGLVGSNIVNVALVNGTVKHQFQTIDSNNYWYTVCPTVLPYDSGVTETLGQGDFALISGLGSKTDNLYVLTSDTQSNLLLDIMYYGYNTNQEISSTTTKDFNIPANAAGVVALNNQLGLDNLIEYKNEAWGDLLTWYNGTQG